MCRAPWGTSRLTLLLPMKLWARPMMVALQASLAMVVRCVRCSQSLTTGPPVQGAT